MKEKNGSMATHFDNISLATTTNMRNDFLQKWGSLITSILVSFIATLLCTHRCWPMAWKRSDILFAGDHYIGDGHAKRMLDSRLGAAFTLCLPFVLGIVGVYIFGDDNIVTAEGLVPAISLKPKLNNLNSTLFNQLHIDLQTFGLLSGVNCSKVLSFDTTQASDMTCQVQLSGGTIAVASSDVGTVCRIKATCDVSGNLALSSILLVGLPEVFQNINYSVRADSWNGIEPDKVVGETFGPTEGKALVGKKDKPTEVNFELTRSRYSDTRRVGLWREESLGEGSYQYGLQLTKLKKELVEGFSTEGEPTHYVAFNFEASDNIYTLQYSDRESFLAQISRMFTLLLSFLALFRFVKTYIELVIDNAYVYVSKRRGASVPADVHHRTCVLEERLEDLSDGVEKAMEAVIEKKERRPSRRLSAFLSAEDVQLEKEIELVSVENPIYSKKSVKNNFVDASSDTDLVALFKREIESLRREMEKLEASNTVLQGHVEKLERNNTMLQGHIDRLEDRFEQLESKHSSESVHDSCSTHSGLEVSSKSGWKTFQLEDGRVYYQRPDGSTTWETDT